MNNLIEKLLRKSLYTWLKNVSQPKTSIPNTEKACDLIRKATTEPFFTKLREKMQKKMNRDRFKSIISLVLRYQDKDLLKKAESLNDPPFLSRSIFRLSRLLLAMLEWKKRLLFELLQWKLPLLQFAKIFLYQYAAKFDLQNNLRRCHQQQ